jgi:SAM-dependent methyltransferase
MADETIKQNVKDKYGKVARGEIKLDELTSCGCSCGDSCSTLNMASRYDDVDRNAIPEGADLGLGCGTPVAFAELKEGQTVLDLGSGAGIDVFVAANYVGPAGKVIGVDMTEEMIQKARENAKKINATNVEFRFGEIESLPVGGNLIDRVISNCVINLVPDKEKAFSEIHRVLKPGGRFIISDIVVDGDITEKERNDASLWANCISGALKRDEYLAIIGKTGFKDIKVVSEKRYDYNLDKCAGLFSITVVGTKGSSCC